MKTYFSFFRMRFLTLIQYRTAAIAGATTQLVFGIMLVLVMQAFFASSDAPQPMSLSQAITYIWLARPFWQRFRRLWIEKSPIPCTPERWHMNSPVPSIFTPCGSCAPWPIAPHRRF